MKSCVGSAPIFHSLRSGLYRKYCYFSAKTSNIAVVKGCIRRQHQVLLGIGVLLILCWLIGSIWLINARQGDHGPEELLERHEIIVALLP